jgi:hypothetical protein
MATKPAIVTQKQLDESGFDNLRDYLNAQRGLTRRGEQKTVGGKLKVGEYKPRDSDARKGENATSKNAVPRDSYVRSGQKAFDTETEFVPPDMSNYKPRRSPEPLTSTVKPGTNTNYENTEGMKKGGMTASKRADGIAQRGKTRGKVC